MLKARVLASLLRNCFTFRDLKEYIKENVDNNKISYETLKYLYKNLYYKKSPFLKQNIYPIGEFLKKGYSTKEAENLAKLLDDANGLTIFCYDKKEIGYKYNKLFYDLLFVFDVYDNAIKSALNKDEAYLIAKNEVNCTSCRIREIEMQLKENELIFDDDIKSFYHEVTEEGKNIKNKMLDLNNKNLSKDLLEKYNRLNKTKKLIQEVKPYKDYVTR